MHNLLLCFAFVGSISAKRQVQMSMAKWMTEQKYRLLMVAILHEERERERQTERGESYARQLMIVFNCWKLTLLCRIEKWIRRTRNYEDTITSWTAGRRRVLATRFLVAPGAVPLSLSVYLPLSSPCHSNHLQCGWLPRIASQRGGKYAGNYLSLANCFCVFLVSRISFSQLSALFTMCCCHVSGHSLSFSLSPSHSHSS